MMFCILQLVLLAPCLALQPELTSELICPAIPDYPAIEQTILVPCDAAMPNKGVCNAHTECVAQATATHPHQVCKPQRSCKLAGAACTCAEMFVCQRRIAEKTFVYATCVDIAELQSLPLDQKKQTQQRKRQELLDEEFDEDDDEGPQDRTLSFAFVLVFTYVVIGALACIYIESPRAN